MEKKDYTQVEHNRTEHIERLLLSRGVDYVNLLRKNSHFGIEESLVKIEANIPNVVRQSVPVKKQYQAIQSILMNPLKGKYVLGISSFPSDLRAKQFAIQVMRNAIEYQKAKKIKKDYPLWYKLTGSYKCFLRDMDDQLPASMLICSGINNESTALKVEKLRDVLEKYQNIPRIVVLGGIDPATFFANRLHFPLTAGVYLGPENRVRESI
jgi:hypothetical protein